MATDNTISDHCLLDHVAVREIEDMRPFTGPSWTTPVWFLRMALLVLDRKMHFRGFRGGTWRALGVVRSDRNPNICNI